jgi:hypothetical protein
LVVRNSIAHLHRFFLYISSLFISLQKAFGQIRNCKNQSQNYLPRHIIIEQTR